MCGIDFCAKSFLWRVVSAVCIMNDGMAEKNVIMWAVRSRTFLTLKIIPRDYPLVIKHGWKIPELNGVFMAGKSPTDLWSMASRTPC